MPETQKIKIIYLIRTLHLGGAERYLVESAARVDRERFTPKIYCLAAGGHQQARLEAQGIDVTVFDVPHTQLRGQQLVVWGWKKFWALYQYLRSEQPDIVHCYMFTPSIYGGLAAKLAGVRTIITSRMRLGLFKDGKPHYQMLENLVNLFAQAVVANSQSVKADVLRRERIVPEKVHVIYGGVDCEKYVAASNNADAHVLRLQKKQEFGIPDDAPVIGIIANLHACKGHHDFIAAAAVVHQAYPQARFLCIGRDRGIQAQLEQQRRELGLEEHVVFTGVIREVAELYPMLDIQVSASHQEGFSSTILEGMAAGKPIIATTVGGSPEAVADGVSGLLVPPRNPDALARAITELLAHPERAIEMGKEGQTRAKKYFPVNNMVAELESLYLKSFVL